MWPQAFRPPCTVYTLCPFYSLQTFSSCCIFKVKSMPLAHLNLPFRSANKQACFIQSLRAEVLDLCTQVTNDSFRVDNRH